MELPSEASAGTATLGVQRRIDRALSQRGSDAGCPERALFCETTRSENRSFAISTALKWGLPSPVAGPPAKG